jgi:hypothetical protein
VAWLYPDELFLVKGHEMLDAMARWLGYEDAAFYNTACITRPAEVRRRLREAK